jgi:hypothetical protein
MTWEEKEAAKTAETLTKIEGKVIARIAGLEPKSEQVDFHFTDGSRVELYHDEDCCSFAQLQDVEDYSPEEFKGATILKFEESYSGDNSPQDVEYLESFTWTFYRIQTTAGPLVLRWLGQSNGYYSERVNIHYFDAE